jgi:hypothetical protein
MVYHVLQRTVTYVCYIVPIHTHSTYIRPKWTYNSLRAIDRIPLSWVASNRLDPRERNVSMSSNPSNTQYADILDLPAVMPRAQICVTLGETSSNALKDASISEFVF